MQTLGEIRSLLAERGLRPKRSLGQNFLHDHGHVRRLVDAAGLGPGDLALEVGPGTGVLTETLLETGASVIASELDDALADLIDDRLGDRVTLVRGDCLGSDRRLAPSIVAALDGRPFTLVANLPYQAASPLMSSLAADVPGCRGQYVTIQKEVADRLVAVPGTKAYGPLGIVLAATSAVRRLAVVPPGCFWPAPKVTSAQVAVEPLDEPLTDRPRAFGRFVVELFSRRRKQLGAILGRDRDWPEGVEPAQRPEVLTVERLVALHELVEPRHPADPDAAGTIEPP